MTDEVNTFGDDNEPFDELLDGSENCCGGHPERHRWANPPAWACGVPAHRVTLEFSPDGDVHAVTLRRVGSGPAISQRTLNEFSLAKAVAAIAEFEAAIAADPVLGAMFPADRAEFVCGLHQRRSGRRPKPDEVWLSVAEQFVRRVAGGERAPISGLAEYYGKPRSTVNNWVEGARKRGILARPGQGRPTAELTEYGRELLANRSPSQPSAPWLARPRVSERQ